MTPLSNCTETIRPAENCQTWAITPFAARFCPVRGCVFSGKRHTSYPTAGWLWKRRAGMLQLIKGDTLKDPGISVKSGWSCSFVASSQRQVSTVPERNAKNLFYVEVIFSILQLFSAVPFWKIAEPLFFKHFKVFSAKKPRYTLEKFDRHLPPEKFAPAYNLFFVNYLCVKKYP